MDKNGKVRIAFFGYENFIWTGGLNYLKTLLYSVSLQDKRKVEAFVFVSRAANPLALVDFQSYAHIKTIPACNPFEILIKKIDKITGSGHYISYLIKKYKIDIISHSFVKTSEKRIKKISWIPDFQHLHLPHMFSTDENNIRNRTFQKKIEWADYVIVSSFDAYKDFVKFSPSNISKARVIHFVSSIDDEIYKVDQSSFQEICKKYKMPNKFFYLPNQFWKHKNHKVVFESIKLLKSSGIEISIVCTGNMSIAEVEENVQELKKFIHNNNIEPNVFLLGLIGFKEVQTLIRYSVSVLNPSLFEGWSSPVEECKSLGKNMIISDIPVHREQDPPETRYFNPFDAEGLSRILSSKWNNSTGGPDYDLEASAQKNLKSRLKLFGENYIQLINELV